MWSCTLCKTLKWLLNHSIKKLERLRGAPFCIKFESMFDGTVEYFDDESEREDEEDEDDDEEDCHDEEEDENDDE